jgi:FtsH-binding integral membrane protein
VPTYLRWIAALTAGISSYFTYTILTFGIARAAGYTELKGAAGALVVFGAYIVSMVTALGVSDWLAHRYPRRPARDQRSVSERL